MAKVLSPYFLKVTFWLAGILIRRDFWSATARTVLLLCTSCKNLTTKTMCVFHESGGGGVRLSKTHRYVLRSKTTKKSSIVWVRSFFECGRRPAVFSVTTTTTLSFVSSYLRKGRRLEGASFVSWLILSTSEKNRGKEEIILDLKIIQGKKN